MKMSNLYLPTLKEEPKEAEIVSHKLMLRAGMIRKHGNGIYSFLPLAMKVIEKVEKIVRREMNKAGAQEVLLPVLQSAEIWQESGRWEEFGPLMIKLQDRNERNYCLGPTHEEVITDLIRDEVRSYKDLPFNLYQIQTKVRDEIRPRFGLMRAREFIMKDAYSMDRDFEGLDVSYQAMYQAYQNIFAACGLKTRVVEADSGAMGGKDSHEFMVLAENGEDEIVFCTGCDYAANNELARARADVAENSNEELKAMEKKKTPGKKTIAELVEFLDIKEEKMIKSVAILADGKPVLALVSGDDQLNEVKLKNYLQAKELSPVEGDMFAELFNSPAGYTGPVGLQEVKIVADLRIKDIKNAVSGANQVDYHYINVNPERDFQIDEYVDLRKVKAGDKCLQCGAELEIKRGIEVGHIFKLGTKYSDSMQASYLDENGREQPVVMGSYGIGITRMIAAAIEQNNDSDGIIWPEALAPYQVIILPLGKSEEVKQVTEKLYNYLNQHNIETLLDDRKERAGVKFNDADLTGIPLRVTVGSRSLADNVIEVRERKDGNQFKLPVGEAGSRLVEILLEKAEEEQ